MPSATAFWGWCKEAPRLGLGKTAMRAVKLATIRRGLPPMVLMVRRGLKPRRLDVARVAPPVPPYLVGTVGLGVSVADLSSNT